MSNRRPNSTDLDPHAPNPTSNRPTPLQKHVGFWDRNKDGVIWPWETYQGFSALGFNPFICFISALAFHLLHVSYYTQDSWIPNPLLPVTVKNIHWAKHGSDTETYDTDGQFVAQKFEGIFAKHDRDHKGGVSFRDITHMWRGNRNVLDFVGWSFQFFLWTYLWCLAADPVTGILRKEDVLKQYDGTLYYEIEARRKNGEKLPWWRGGTGFGRGTKEDASFKRRKL